MTLKEKSIAFFGNTYAMPSILLVLTLIITIQNLLMGANDFWGGNHTYYNNYVIFKHSFFHLLENKNLYLYYPAEYADLFKYSPTFALSIAVLSWMPDALGLFCWNALNIFVLYSGLKAMKCFTKEHTFMLMNGFLVFELVLSTQNSQSNALLAGLTIIAYNQFEKNRNNVATLLIVAGFFIKIYSVLGALLIILYPNKIKSILYMVLWSILLFILPLMAVSPAELIAQYQNWLVMLKADQSASIGMSIYIYSQHMLSSATFKTTTLVFGVAALLLPLMFVKKHSNKVFRAEYLSLILIWMVIFNYKAESPTFIIAMSGIAIWFFITELTSYKKALFFLCLIFTSLWFTDIVPRNLKNSIVDVNYIKPFFPMLVLFLICFDLVTKAYTSSVICKEDKITLSD
jgi:hypothetical protein